jgi:hypothetical protein
LLHMKEPNQITLWSLLLGKFLEDTRVHCFKLRHRGDAPKIPKPDNMWTHKNIKKVQRLNGCTTALSWFNSLLDDMGLFFFILFRFFSKQIILLR